MKQSDISELLHLNSTSTAPAHARMTSSKYGMLEIFRAAYNRVEAVLMLRQLSKKFHAMSRDKYLDVFYDEQDTMYLEVRKEADLEYFKKMSRYFSMIKGDNCLHIEFFWNFQRNQTQAEEVKECERLVDILLEPSSFKKLTIGSDGLWSRYLPQAFVAAFIREVGRRQTKFTELCFDF